MLLVGLQILAWGLAVSVTLWSIKGPYHLSGGTAFFAGVAVTIVLGTWASWARTRIWLALPLLVLFSFWPLAVPGPMDIRMKFFIAALALNLLAFPMLLKTRRKPFAEW
jgi:hypothetical protein